MSNKNSLWKSLELSRTTAFTIAGLLFVVPLILLAINIAEGTQEHYRLVGQAFVGTAWTATFIGLLGSHSSLVAESRWAIRLGSLFALIGLVTSLTMAIVMFGLFFGFIEGSYSEYMSYFIPGFIISIPLSCGLYGATFLKSTVYRTRMGLLVLMLAGAFIFNYGTGLAGINLGGATKIFGVVAVLTLTNIYSVWVVQKPYRHRRELLRLIQTPNKIQSIRLGKGIDVIYQKQDATE